MPRTKGIYRFQMKQWNVFSSTYYASLLFRQSICITSSHQRCSTDRTGDADEAEQFRRRLPSSRGRSMRALIIGDLPRIHAKRMPDLLAYIDGPASLTWRELNVRVNRLCHGLRARFGVEAGDRIAILSPNCHEYVEVMFAASRMAAIYTGLNTRYNPLEMIHQLTDSGSKLLIADPGFEAIATEIAARTGTAVLQLGSGPDGYEALLESAPDTEIDSHGDEHAPYTLTYTSGTTGEPKGAMISSRNEVVFAQSLAWASESRCDDRALVALPLFHKGGQFAIMHPAYLGLTTVILPSPEPHGVLAAIERHRPTFGVLVPTVMKMLVDAMGQEQNRSRDLSSLRHIIYGSNPIRAPLMREFSEIFNCTLSQIGGIGTEGGIALVLNRVDHAQAMADPALGHRLESCGRVQPGFEMMLVDEDDKPVGPGERGEMVFRGDAFISGYWKRPEASARLWRSGWLHSGDIGRMDSDGFVYYVDRKAGRIKTGAETVYAREVEAVLRECPLVAETVVIGIPDDMWGEAIWACVERRATAHSGNPSEDEECIRLFVRSKLTGYKVPKRIVFVEQLPRTALGKLALGEVRSYLLDQQKHIALVAVKTHDLSPGFTASAEKTTAAN